MSAAAAAPPRGRAALKRLLLLPEITGIVLMLLIVAIFALNAPAFFSERSAINVLNILPELGLVTLGITILIVSGEFDLSVGSTFALTPIAALWLVHLGAPPLLGMLGGLCVAASVGFVNGSVTLRFGIPSFITTLGTMFSVRSLAVIFGNLTPLDFPEAMPVGLLVARFGRVQASVLWLAVIALLLAALLHRTRLGNWIYATGGAQQAARDMGVNTRAVKLACFMLCSVLAGFAGLIQTFRLQSPLAMAGDGIELQAIAGAVIGGTALSGGVGSVLGALIGTVLLRVIDTGMTMSRIDANWFQLAVGLLTVGSVVINVVIRNRATRMRA